MLFPIGPLWAGILVLEVRLSHFVSFILQMNCEYLTCHLQTQFALQLKLNCIVAFSCSIKILPPFTPFLTANVACTAPGMSDAVS